MAALPGGLAARFGLTAAEAAAIAIGDLALNAIAALGMAALLRKGYPMRGSGYSCALISGLAWIAFFEAGDSSAAVGASAILLAAVGALNAIIWGMLPAVTPQPRASGATSGLVTQATYIGVLLGPPGVFAGLQSSMPWMLPLAGPATCLLLALNLPTRKSAHVDGR